MNYDASVYDDFIARLADSGGAMQLSLNEALQWWIVALQREFAMTADVIKNKSAKFGKMPLLMVLGMGGDDELFTEVVLTEDDPENLVDETWGPIELWAG